MLTPRNHRASLRAGFALLALSVFSVPEPLRAQTYKGTFAGDGMILTLQPSGERLLGTLVYNRQFYAVEAEQDGGKLRGTFSTGRGEFEFTAELAGAVLLFETDGIVYSLLRGGSAQETPAAPSEPEPESETAIEEPAATAREDVETSAQASGDRPEPDVPQDPAPAAAVEVENEPAAQKPARASAEATRPVPDDRDVERDDELAGSWAREKIAADAGTPFERAIRWQLGADGTFVIEKRNRQWRGRWHTEDGRLFLAFGRGRSQPYCRYRLVADTLLCTFGSGSRQLWHRD